MKTLDAKDDCGCGKAKPKPISAADVPVDAELTCLACGHKWMGSVPLRFARTPLESDVFDCNECLARMAYGKLLLREVIEPHVDEKGNKWARRRFQDPKTKEDLFVIDVDRESALTSAKEFISLVTL